MRYEIPLINDTFSLEHFGNNYMLSPMNSINSVDSLLVTPSDFEKYNGHCGIEKLEIARNGLFSARETNNHWMEHDISNWLLKPQAEINAIDPLLRLVMIQTRNPSTARSPPRLPGEPVPEVGDLSPKLSEPQAAYANFVKKIFANVGFPLSAFGSYIKGHITFVATPSPSSSHSGPRTAYYCSGTSWTITWVHYPAAKYTAALLFYREGDGDDRKHEFLRDLRTLSAYRGHPMLLAYIKTKISTGWTFDLLDDMNRETLGLEQEIGFPTWNWILDRPVPGKETIGDNHDDAVGRFNVLSGKLTNIRFRLRTFQEQIKFILRGNTKYRASLRDNDLASIKECTELEDMMNVIQDFTNVFLFDADTLAERLGNQMQSVFQLTTQRDSQASLKIADINNELAWQGRATNSSMMTIAFVSLLFLPATFVASFFATPIFNWNPPTDQVVVVEPFWIYWTVSGLLTLSLCVGWFQYLRHKRHVDNQERRVASKKFRDRLRFRQGSIRNQGYDISPSSSVTRSWNSNNRDVELGLWG